MGTEVASDGRYPSGSKTSHAISSRAQIRNKETLANRSRLPNGSSSTTARESSLHSSKKTGPAMFRKLERKKPSDWKVDVGGPHAPSMALVSGDSLKDRDEKVMERGEERNRFTRAESKEVLFNENRDEKMQKFGGSKAGARVAPCRDEISESTAVASNNTEDLYRHQRESNELSLIRNQLVQIENQQSSLLGLLQVICLCWRNWLTYPTCFVLTVFVVINSIVVQISISNTILWKFSQSVYNLTSNTSILNEGMESFPVKPLGTRR